MLSHFLVSLLKIHCPTNPHSCLPTNPLQVPGPRLSLHWGIETSQDQVPLLLLMTYKAILCYICSWSHEFNLVYS